MSWRTTIVTVNTTNIVHDVAVVREVLGKKVLEGLEIVPDLAHSLVYPDQCNNELG